MDFFFQQALWPVLRRDLNRRFGLFYGETSTGETSTGETLQKAAFMSIYRQR
ncbi:MAG: hypothetical protein SXA11_15045 [Cyanobacteriota bacterium]|nr:hypothetical protein [Cyanobacteriota bacterium]